MAKLPPFKRIAAEQFTEDEVSRLVGLINRFQEDTYRALNGNLTIDNLRGRFYDAEINGTYPLKLAWDLRSPPTDAWITKAREKTGSHTNFSSALFLDWEYTADGKFQINAIPGLTASATAKYIVRIKVEAN